MSRNRELISKIGLRLDGRRPDELRRIRCKMGVFSQPDGSAYIEQGLTKVLAAVYGPHQVRSRQKAQHDACIINTQFSMAVFSTNERKKRPRGLKMLDKVPYTCFPLACISVKFYILLEVMSLSYMQLPKIKPPGDRKSTEMSMHLQQALLSVIETDLYPWSQIDVYVEVLHADGGIYPACVNAATLAVIDAGIPIKEYVCACTASLGNNEVPMLDVSHQEEILGGPTLTVAALPMSGKIVLMEMSQRFHLDHLPKVLNKALEGCKDVKAILDEAVKNHVSEIGSATGWANTTS